MLKYPDSGGSGMRQSVGFIGGGRVSRIIIEAWNKSGTIPEKVVVSDTNAATLEKLHNAYPEIRTFLNDNAEAARQDVVFVAVHPPSAGDVLGAVKPVIRNDAILISLMPKLTIKAIAGSLGGFNRIVRVIPNAPAIVQEGYNPLAFSPALGKSEREEIRGILSPLGHCPEVQEETLEAYAILSAMGPTYLWFQLYEMEEIGRSFGLSRSASREAVAMMAEGAIHTITRSDLSPGEVMDLVPVKPLGEDEPAIRGMYRSRLGGLYAKLKN
jgi:pyrroline-5-carboxylate reductase